MKFITFYFSPLSVTDGYERLISVVLLYENGKLCFGMTK